MHCLTTWGQWAVEQLQYTASLPRGSGQWAVGTVQGTATLPGGSWKWNSYNVLPQCPGGTVQSNFCNALHHGAGAVGSETRVMHSHTVRGQWAVELLQCTATLPGDGGQCDFGNALLRFMGVVGSATPAMHRHTAWGRQVVEHLQSTAFMPGGSGQFNSFNALHSLHWGSGKWNPCNVLPHCLWAVGSGTHAMHCLTASGQWAVELLQCTATLPGGGWQWNSYHALPHCSGLVTWHQSKNSQDGRCGTDCQHALPTSKSIVIRRGSLCVFRVSGRVHPARQPSRTPPWAKNAVL